MVAGAKNGRNRNLLSSLSLELIVHSKDKFARLSMKIPHSSLSFNVPYKDSTCAYSSPLCSFCVLNLLWLRQMYLAVPLRLLATIFPFFFNSGGVTITKELAAIGTES